MSRAHQPVLLEEAIAALMVSADGSYVDGTFGRGGHSTRILDALSPSGALLGLDQDPAAESAARHLIERDHRFQFLAVNFRALGDYVAPGSLQGVLLDLGVSSPQLDDPERGFSFTHDGPLDMRMNTSAGQSATDWLASVGEGELARVLRDLGEERFASSHCCRDCQRASCLTDRAHCPDWPISSLRPIQSGSHHKHPATRSFQAIRSAGERGAGRIAGGARCHAVLALAPGGQDWW